MTTRTIETIVTFKNPFTLTGLNGVQPAGRYGVETDQELLEGISFPAYRRIATRIRLHAPADRPGTVQVLDVDPKELEAARMRDAAVWAADRPARAAAGRRRNGA